MSGFKIILALLLVFAGVFSAKSQIVGFRFATNTNLFITELGESDVPHPDAYLSSPALSSDKYTPQPTIGFEGEVLFQVSPMSLFGVELEYSKLKGYNDNPPVYNYYLTPYFEDFQRSGEYFNNPVAYNTTLFNVAVNWKYFFFRNSQFKPFVKLTGVVAFVGTDFTYKDSPDFLESDVLYARGSSNSDQEKWPAFHVGGGIGFDYEFAEHWSFQIDATSTVINSDIINGAPNFTYINEDGGDMLKYQKHPTLTMQISAGLVYYIEVRGSGGSSGKTNSSFPFYRKK